MGVRSHVYNKKYMYQKELYLNRQLVTFYKEVGYVGGIVPPDTTSQ